MSDRKRKRITWFVNPATHELHRFVEGEDHPARCNIKDKNYLKQYPSAKAARDDGNDVSAYCTVKFKSRENT